MNTHALAPGWIAGLVVALFLGGISPVRSTVLDDFNASERTAWEDLNPINLPLPGGIQANGRFTFTLPPPGQGYFVSSRKTSETFELKEGRTIEFRVDMISGLGPDSFAVLAFIPQATGPNTLAGYGIAKSETDILITKGINKYFYNENPIPAVKNENVTLVLQVSAKGGSVFINGQILDKDDGNRVLWEKTYVDTPAADVLSDGEDDPQAPFINLPGNFVLYLYADGGTDPAGYQVVFDNAETFVCDTVLLDDFNAAERSGWEDSNPIDLPLPGGQQGNGVFTFAMPPPGQGYFVASRKTTSTYELTEGSRHEFSVDLKNGQGPDSFAVLAWIPLATGPNTLAGYGLSKSETDVLITKGINKYFYNENPVPAIKNNNVRLVLTLTVQKGYVTIRGRVLDNDADGAVLFDKTFVDTPNADIFSDGEDSPPAPFLTTGNVVLYLYADGGTDPAGYQVVYDDLMVCVPPAATNSAPAVSQVTPVAGANFLAPSTQLGFTVTDDQDISDAGIEVTLNGTRYTSANGLVLGGSGRTRTGSLGGFASNTDYSGEITVTDAGGLTTSADVAFDTFTTDNRIIEVEDYNFGGGGYHNNPVRTTEGGGAADNSYTDQVGTPAIDYFETRPTPRPQDTMYRTQDPIRMAHSLDRRRATFDNDAGIYDYDVGDLAASEWMNYTRDFAEGTYDIYLREATINLPRGDSVLERVTSDPARDNQTVEILGTFLSSASGFVFRNIPLTDGSGSGRIRVDLSGRGTLRLRTVTADTAGGSRLLNYLLFVPVTNAAPQRAAVAALAPSPGAMIDSVTPTIAATIQNFDTSVDVSTVKVRVNGTEVSGATVTATSSGATVVAPLQPLPPPGTSTTATIVFRDSENQEIQTDWEFVIQYRLIGPELKIAGTGKDPGFQTHVVQAPQDPPLENSLDRAESQIAANSTIPRVVDTNAVVDVINFNKRLGVTAGSFEEDLMVPGIDPDTTGNGDNDFAVEILTCLELSAGVHRFGVISDDGYKLSVGIPPISSGTAPLAFHNGGSADESFEFVVAEGGLYAFRMLWYERAGSGHAEWFSIDSGGTPVLINDPTAPGAVKAWREVERPPVDVTLESAPSVTGPYGIETGATINQGTRSVTVAVPGANRFYRLRGASALTIKTIELQGANLVLTWQ